MLTFTFIAAALLTTTHAANDWSVPCTSGSCSYDFVGTNTTAPATMSLNGSHQLLSDISPAAGWQILDCDPNWSNGSQVIRMMCMGTPEQMSHCNHIDNGGATDTVVRLPENCGTGPFAHVNSTFTPTNQSIPLNLTLPDGSRPEVRGLLLDYDFDNVPTSRGTLNLSVASTNDGAPTPIQKRTRSHMPRKSPSSVTPAAPAATTSQSLTSTKIPINVLNQSFPLLNTNISCKSAAGGLAGAAALKVDVDALVQAQVEFGYTFSGSLIPLKLNGFTMFAELTGDASATFHIDTKAQGTFNTGPLEIFQSGLLGLSVPGIISLGPKFSISSLSQFGNMQVAALADITTDVKFPKLRLQFPQPSTPESVLPEVPPQLLQLSVSNPSVDFNGNIVGHLIPSMEFGLSLGKNAVSAFFFIDMDMSGTVLLQFKAGHALTQAASSSAVASAVAPTPLSATPIRGCANVSVDVAVHAGFNGTISGLTTKQFDVPVFKVSKNLFDNCTAGFAASAPATPAVARSARGLTGGSTVARAARYADVEKRVFGKSKSKSKSKSVVQSTRAAAGVVATAVAGAPPSQATNPSQNLIRPQTSTASTSGMSCAVELAVVNPLTLTRIF